MPVFYFPVELFSVPVQLFQNKCLHANVSFFSLGFIFNAKIQSHCPEIAAIFNASMLLKDPLIKVILCAVLLSLVSSNCRLIGGMIFLGTSLGHRSIQAPSESSPMNQQEKLSGKHYFAQHGHLWC